MVFIIVSISFMLIEKSEGDKFPPCVTPHFYENVPLDPFHVLTLLLILLYMLSIIFKNLPLMPLLINFVYKRLLFTLSKALLKSMKAKCKPPLCISVAFWGYHIHLLYNNLLSPNYSYCILHNHLHCSTPVISLCYIIITQLYNYCINTVASDAFVISGS